jgi:hypothetical protein
MSTQHFARFALRVVTVGAVLTAPAACGRASTTEPQRAVRSAVAANHDEIDPSTCRSGYQVVDGHVVCN